MKKLCILASAFLLSLPAVYADEAVNDTLVDLGTLPAAVVDGYLFHAHHCPGYIKQLDEVVVTGSREEVELRHLPYNVSVVSNTELKQSNNLSILPTVAQQVPGLFLTSRGVLGYGVSGGAAGGLSLRGVSAGAGQMLVLIDGHPQYMGLFGHPVADTYLSDWVERVEVLRGPASVLYGSNALGGVLNIVTRKGKPNNGAETDLSMSYGSYNTAQIDAATRFRYKKFFGAASANYSNTDGHRDNMMFRQYGGSLKLGYYIDRHWNVGANGNVTFFKDSNPGAVTAPLSQADQSVLRGYFSASVNNEYRNTSGSVNAFYSFGKHKINDGYGTGESPKDYLYKSDDDMWGVSAYQTYSFLKNSNGFFRNGRVTVGADFFHFGGEAWNDFFDTTKPDKTIADTTQYEVAGYVNYSQGLFWKWLTIDLGLRYDYHSVTHGEWVPQGGVVFHASKDIDVKASVSKGFRNPTLRELYMFKPANAELDPENIMNYELSYRHRLLDSRMVIGLNAFYIKGDNLIQTVMGTSGPKNLNTGEIENCGAELSFGYNINNSWCVNANYSFLHMENPVIAAPEHNLYASVSYNNKTFWHGWGFNTGIQYVDGLYTAVGTVEQKENFVLWNANAYINVLPGASVFVRVDNILAQKYEINAGFPMPKATAFAGVKLHF